MARDYLYSWNQVNNDKLKSIKIEEDIRDALQNVRATQPSISQRKRLLDLSASVGIQIEFIGFPAASQQEVDRCIDLVDHISRQGTKIEPVLMARAIQSDVIPILEIQQKASFAVTADIFIGTSALRRKVEGWSLDTVLDKMQSTAEVASKNNLNFRISLEDSTRTCPSDLEKAVKMNRPEFRGG